MLRTREAEESPLLKAVVRQRLVKTQQDRKGLAVAVVNCELRRLVRTVSQLQPSTDSTAAQSQNQSYFTTGGFTPIISSWRQAQ
jgi:hypothetical protein